MKVEGGSTSSTFILAFISTFIVRMNNKVAKKTRITALEYCRLKDAFCNAKYSSPGILARLLLEAFIFEDGDINSEWFVRERACTKGSFTKLRDRLVGENWLHFREDTKRYFAGTRLRPHLDAVKSAKAVTFADLELKASKADLEELDSRKADKSIVQHLESTKADRTELQDLKVRMNEIAEAVKQLQTASIPPDDEEKKAVRKDATAKLGKLAAVN